MASDTEDSGGQTTNITIIPIDSSMADPADNLPPSKTTVVNCPIYPWKIARWQPDILSTPTVTNPIVPDQYNCSTPTKTTPHCMDKALTCLDANGPSSQHSCQVSPPSSASKLLPSSAAKTPTSQPSSFVPSHASAFSSLPATAQDSSQNPNLTSFPSLAPTMVQCLQLLIPVTLLPPLTSGKQFPAVLAIGSLA